MIFMFIKMKGLYHFDKRSWVEDRVINTDYIKYVRRLTSYDKDGTLADYDYSISFDDGKFYISQSEFNKLCSGLGVRQ